MGTVVAFDGSQPSRPVGYYTYQVADDAWSWSDEIYALHGYAPQEVPATTAVLLSHKHPEDRERTFQVMLQVLADGRPFSCYHRIIDRNGKERSVLSVGRGIKDSQGSVARLEGFLVDLTEVRRTETQAGVEVALARIAEHREVIEQAKGMVMLACGCGADEAFELLRRASQRHNVKLHQIARSMAEAAGDGLGGPENIRNVLGAASAHAR